MDKTARDEIQQMRIKLAVYSVESVPCGCNQLRPIELRYDSRGD